MGHVEALLPGAGYDWLAHFKAMRCLGNWGRFRHPAPTQIIPHVVSSHAMEELW